MAFLIIFGAAFLAIFLWAIWDAIVSPSLSHGRAILFACAITFAMSPFLVWVHSLDIPAVGRGAPFVRNGLSFRPETFIVLSLIGSYFLGMMLQKICKFDERKGSLLRLEIFFIALVFAACVIFVV